MPVFQYSALDRSGHEVKAEVEALSDKEAISKVRNKGLFPTKVTSKAESKKVKAATLPKKRRAVGKVKSKRICAFARQLSTLQDAGLTILRSLRTLERQQKSGRMKRVIGYIAEDIEGGSTLSEAMARHPKCFNRLFVNMVAAGEVGGVLDIILSRVADFMEKSQRLKSKVRSAMIYPAAVMISAMFIVLGLMMFVIPTFSEILTNLSDGKQELPGITIFLMRTSEWLVGRSGLNGLIVIVTPFLIITSLKLIRRFRAGRYVFDTIKLKIPILRKVVYKTSVARWTRTLATLINAGVPLLEALNITRETASNEVHSRMLWKVQHAIRQGDTFANPLRQSNTVDWVVVNMLEVGEEAGDMDKMLVKVANNFDEEADLMISGMMSLLEPIMILFLGAIVGTIVLAIFLPIIEILLGMLGR